MSALPPLPQQHVQNTAGALRTRAPQIWFGDPS
ncbi:hypothetical protein SAMN04515673_101206 [Poseidonocella sedimentorum]|uniref:Uncharacterized protein n=1 Tax=Poseidonocella sedimentorum TaxID=871652 RepID=A0A1I6CQK7_9RHOB|nr:hypothetical protein SAMN04515673_101206 [Poseidonocella sedimentorum]